MTKKKPSLLILSKLIILSELIWLDKRAYEILQMATQAHNHPYNHLEVEVNELPDEDKNEFIMEFIDRMSDTPLFKVANKVDPSMLNELLLYCQNNPYIDYENLATSIAGTKVYYEPKEGTVTGETQTQQDFFGLFSHSNIYLYSNQEDPSFASTYYHEMIHALFPTIDDSSFFEETLTHIITTEYPSENYSIYEYEGNLTKMWIETLGEDVFYKMRTTGSLDTFYHTLNQLGIQEKQVDSIVQRLNRIHELYLSYDNVSRAKKLVSIYPDVVKENTVHNSNILKHIKTLQELALQDIDVAYTKQYGQSYQNNRIMKLYETKSFGLIQKIPEIYYDTEYFTSKESDDCYFIKRDDEWSLYELSQEDMNLIDGEPKSLLKK